MMLRNRIFHFFHRFFHRFCLKKKQEFIDNTEIFVRGITILFKVLIISLVSSAWSFDLILRVNSVSLGIVGSIHETIWRPLESTP